MGFHVVVTLMMLILLTLRGLIPSLDNVANVMPPSKRRSNELIVVSITHREVLRRAKGAPPHLLTRKGSCKTPPRDISRDASLGAGGATALRSFDCWCPRISRHQGLLRLMSLRRVARRRAWPQSSGPRAGLPRSSRHPANRHPQSWHAMSWHCVNTPHRDWHR